MQAIASLKDAAAPKKPLAALQRIGGHAALDFVNTVDWRGRPTPQEYLVGYAALVEWAGHAGLVDAPDAVQLRRRAVDEPVRAAAVLRSPAAHVSRTYPLATEAASLGEIASILAQVTGLSWRYEPQEPEVFFRTVTAAGADPVYMACVRNVFERTRNGSLTEASDTFDTVEQVTGHAPTKLREFFEKHRTALAYVSPR